MQKVHNANREIVCIIDDDGNIIIEARGCRTVIRPDKKTTYKIVTEKKKKSKTKI